MVQTTVVNILRNTLPAKTWEQLGQSFFFDAFLVQTISDYIYNLFERMRISQNHEARQTAAQKDKWTEGQTDRQTYRRMDGQTDGQTEKRTEDDQVDEWTNRQLDKPRTDKQTDR